MLDSKIMRLWLALLSFLCCGVSSLACKCGPPAHLSRYVDTARIVFVGKVLFTNDDSSGTTSQQTFVHFEVDEAFKRLGPETRDVWIDPGSFTSCYAEYRVGERYLVFGSDGAPVRTFNPQKPNAKPKPVAPGMDPKNPPKAFLARECSGTRETKELSSQEIAYLKKYKERAALKQQAHKPD